MSHSFAMIHLPSGSRPRPLRFNMTLVLATLTGMFVIGCATPHSSEPAAFADWPAGKSPREIGYRVATNMLPRWIVTKPSVHYAEDSAWVHGLQFADLTGDTTLKEALIRRFDRFLEPGGTNLISRQRHVDHTIFGIVPLELYLQTKDEKYLHLGKMLADRQWELPTSGGLSGETRFWIDDMYMITILQVQAFRATGDPVYLDRAALEMVAYLEKLQRPNGLFYHGPNFPFFWGRGNGWVAAGMTELLRFLPEKHPQRDRVLQGYYQMMAALLKYQAANGMWHQLLDGPDSYQESSCTAMFTYAMITGVKRGWLPAPTYAAAARKGWLALNEHIDANGLVDQVCVGTGQKNDRQFYLDRPRVKGDHHGQAPTLWCAVALLRSE
jgi:unsaturated rhamnogalacturonyl hydrolase